MLFPSEVHREFCARVSEPRTNFDRGHERLFRQAHESHWTHFYVLVELVWVMLRKHEWGGGYGMPGTESAYRARRRNAPPGAAGEYREEVSKLFADHAVEWRLDEGGAIVRDPGAALSSVIAPAAEAVADHPAARENLESAIAFSTTARLSPKKAITDAVSACESLGIELFPEARDFPDVLRELRDRGESRTVPHSIGSIWKYQRAERASPREAGPGDGGGPCRRVRGPRVLGFLAFLHRVQQSLG